jgi:hypothetical protein
MCLTLSEQKQLLKKAGHAVKKKSPFEIHELLVVSSEIECRLSRKVDHLLNRKFGKEAAALLALDHEAFKASFRKAFEAGDYVWALWAAATSPDLPMEIRREIFGDVHMAMHWSGEQSLKLKQRMARQEEMTGELQQQLKAAKLDRRTLQKENQRLRAKQTRLKAALAAAEKDKSLLAQTLSAPQDRQEENRHELEEIKRENRDLKNRLDILLKGSEEKQRQINLLEGKNGRLREELERQRESIQGFTEEARKNIGQIFALNRCDTTCPSFDLCKKRILIVGGITRMESLYRELIEGCGGVFEYHDGYMKKGTKGLENRLRRADMVVCPVSCNSHAACSIVKNLAKKHNKTVHMLPNSSLSAVSQAIWGGGDQATIN